MGYRLPMPVALNELESSLHSSLLPPLARLLASTARHSRIWVATHSEALADAITEETEKPARRVLKVDEATPIEGLKISGEFRDEQDDH